MLRRLGIYPNSYYNYLKKRKSKYHEYKEEIKNKIRELYHKYNGVAGYRMITVYLSREGYKCSKLTVHKYMNKELKLCSTVRPKKPNYKHGKAHKIFENKLKQNFKAEKKNKTWCTDFTYIFKKNGDVRYNCTIIDLYDRSVIASVTGKNINSQLAVETLKKAIETQPKIKGELILHSDQGTQYTSKMFTEFCKSVNVTQMSSRI